MAREEILYELFTEQVYNEDIGTYQTYGIRDKKKRVVISDITINLKDALIILTTLNSYKVSIEHFKDVVLDLIDTIGETT